MPAWVELAMDERVSRKEVVSLLIRVALSMLNLRKQLAPRHAVA